MTDILIPAKKYLVLDATSMSTEMKCARFYDIRFNHRLVSMKGKSNSLEVGSLIHKVLEVYYKHIIKGFDRKTSLGLAITAGHLYVQGCQHCANIVEMPEGVTKLECGHEPGEYPGMQNTPEFNEGWVVGWRFALDTCEQYSKFYENDSFIPLSAEFVETVQIYEDDEICIGIKAKFDLIIDTNQIGIISMDHKTFKQRRDKSSLSNQFIIHCLIRKSRNVLVNKIGLQSSIKNIGERLTREMVSYSADRLIEWQSEILPYYAYKLLQYQESGYWPPNFTSCDNVYGQCPYKDVCESDPNMREEVLRRDYKIAPVWDPTNREEE